MFDIRKLKIGTKLELELMNDYNAKKNNYISQVLDIVNENTILIAAPIHENRVIFIPDGTSATLIFLHGKQGLLSAPCTILSKDYKGNVAVMHAQINSEFQRIQRRKFFRLECAIGVKYRILEHYNKNEESTINPSDVYSDAYKEAITKNISGSGACLIASEEIRQGSIIELVMPISEDCSIAVIAEVKRSLLTTPGKTRKYEAGVHFINISSTHQEILVKYIFNKQRLLLKKGLLEKEDL